MTNNPVTIDNHAAENQACQISVSFSGSYRGFDNGPSVQLTQVGPAYGIGFSVSVSGLAGDVAVRSTTKDPKPAGWIVEQYVADYNVLNGKVVRQDIESRMDLLGRARPLREGNTVSWRDHPGTAVAGTNSYFTKRNFYIKAYNGNQHCEVEFHMTFRVTNGQMNSPGWGYGRYR